MCFSNAFISLGVDVSVKRSGPCNMQHFHTVESGNKSATEKTVILWPCSEHWCCKCSVQASRATSADLRLWVWARFTLYCFLWKRGGTHPHWPLRSSKGGCKVRFAVSAGSRLEGKPPAWTDQVGLEQSTGGSQSITGTPEKLRCQWAMKPLHAGEVGNPRACCSPSCSLQKWH